MAVEGSKKRPRLTFDVDENLLKTIDEAAEQRGETLREFCLRAIQEFLQPGFHFQAPRPRKPIPLIPFLQGAQEGIAIAGTTLHSLQEPAVVSLLCDKLESDGLSMRFVMIDPDISEDDPTYQLLSKRYAHRYEHGSLKMELNKTVAALETVYRHGLETGCSVRVLGIRALPMTGLTIIDPYSSRARLRVALYLHMHPQELHPFFEIDTRSASGGAAGQAFLQHFDLLTDGARLIYSTP